MTKRRFRPSSARWILANAGCLAAGLLLGCSDEPLQPAASAPAGGWRPGEALPSARNDAPRGMLDVRGLIHAHSVYSHDACDGEPWDAATDAINEPCFQDFRRDICRVAHDFVMLTDHGERFSRTEFPESLLYRPELGDELVERAAQPVANWATCDAQTAPEDAPDRVLILAGNESAMMPVGLEGHVAETEEVRDAIYGNATAENVAALQAQGAVVLAMHTEDWSPDQLVELGFDGFEMYNLHANSITGAGGFLELLSLLNQVDQGAIDPGELPHPDLAVLNVINEDDRYLTRWGSVLASGHRAVTTIGTDCHQNTFPQLLDDDERIDSYRRTMSWMSNHLLIEPEPDGRWDDRHLKEALAEGRLYGVFEVMGFPLGFDLHAISNGELVEMGGLTPLASDTRMRATMPAIRELDPSKAPPRKELVLYRAAADGWQEVARSESDLDEPVDEPGAYRVEVRLEPRHLEQDLGRFTDLADESFVWIYSNAIFVE